MNIKLNAMQQAILTDYENGLYKVYADVGRIPEGFNFGGDPLIIFILSELADPDEDTEFLDVDEGCNRIERVKDDLDVCLLALQKIKEVMIPLIN